MDRRFPRILYFGAVIFIIIIVLGCASVPHNRYPAYLEKRLTPVQRPYKVYGKVYYPLVSSQDFVEEGYASWYGPEFHGNTTSCGEIYNMNALTAAHKILPLHTYVRVTNLENGLKTIVRINDRGPFVKERIIDLSMAAAEELGIIEKGVANVRVEAIGRPITVSEEGKAVETYIQTSDYTSGRFWVQVGAFKNLNNALLLVDRLRRDHADVEVKMRHRDEELFYCVQVFVATDLNEAYSVKDEFDRNGFPDAFIVAE